MHSPIDLPAELNTLHGIVPVFPLPDVVQFPHMALPLHIFEDRYRAMVEDALQGNRLIAMAMLKPGWEGDYAGSPDFHEMLCLGRITAEERLPSGRYNIILNGLQRAMVVEEQTKRPYRQVSVVLCPDFYPDQSALNHAARQRELLGGFRRLFQHKPLDPLFQQVMESDIPLGVLCDVLAGMLQIGPAEKQKLLDEVNVDRRSTLLLWHIRQEQARTADSVGHDYPPQFSAN